MMDLLKNRMGCMAIAIFFSVFSYGQEKDSVDFYKTAVYGNVGAGAYVGIYMSAGINVERMLLEKKKSWQIERTNGIVERDGRLALFLSLSYGGYGVWFEDLMGKYLSLKTGLVLGPGKNHFETTVGAGYFFGESNFRTFLPTGSIGYRLQKPGDHLILRMGVAFPEQAYFGFGLCF